ncbi:MAG: ATP-binding protein [Clostridiales bacterium]|nr:ATP-binding protein [Clostridiales bacterium]
MIIQFSFKNYKSFRDEVTLDMTATKMTELNNHVANIGNDKLLKIAAICGANASGKSNIYDAFEYMSHYVHESFNFGGDSESKPRDKKRYPEVTPFLFDVNVKDEPTSFEVFFIDNQDSMQKTYQYGFSLLHNSVEEEWLYVKTRSARSYRTIFYRKRGEKTDFTGISKGAENIELSLQKESLIVSLGAKLKINLLKKVRDWFFKNEVVDFGDPIENLIRSQTLPFNFEDNREVQKQVIKYFSTFDESIKDFRVKVESATSTEEDDKITIEALHKNNRGELISIPLQKESNGTLKMFALYPPVQQVMENGSTLFVDELNARLHPLLVRNIILSFANPEINRNNAQLIFTTHDAWLLSNDILRRDEIWFVDKDVETGVSDLYSLADFSDDNGNKIRKDEAYSKNYLLGKYGAIPHLKSLDVLEGDKYGE